ncbi:MAG TPA: FAD:protein FMN transferase [Rubrivivax sp.]|nr:FAD:protein FMN transferase [Rubrivivax sp.]
MDTLLSPRRRSLLGAFGALTALGVAGCGSRTATPEGQRFAGMTMGSTYTVRTAGRVLPAQQLERLAADVQSALDSVDSRMSLYRPESELSRLNAQPAGLAFSASNELLHVLRGGQQVTRLSEGAFDMTVAPLVLAWGFGPGAAVTGPAIPAAAQVSDGRRLLGHAALELDAARGAAIKHRAGLALDLGGIAKGHGVDRAAQVLQDAGVEHFMVEVGGEVRTAGLNHLGQAWRIGIEEPDAMPRRARLVLPVSGQSVATSGDYRNYFEENGRRYSHTIDPATGEPIAHGLASVSVVADNCLLADALATALNVLGPDRGMALAQREGIAAHFIVRRAGGDLRDYSSQAMLALRGGLSSSA